MLTEKVKMVFFDRIIWLMLVAFILFLILVFALFELQIRAEESFAEVLIIETPRTGTVVRTVQGVRGEIFDRHGRPLAINTTAFAVVMDPSVPISNEALLKLALLLEENNERYVDSFPMTRERPFEFTFFGATDEIIRWQEHRFKDDLAVPDPWEATAEETWEFLIHQWGIDGGLYDEDIRRIMNFRAKIFVQRLIDLNNFTPQPIVFAHDVSRQTIAAIEEHGHIFTGLYIRLVTLRYYPAGRYVSHMIGYLLPITAEQLSQNEHLGYTAFDLFGRAGLELSMEHYLRGILGEETFEVNAAGRRLSEPVILSEPLPGNRVYLTIDLELQRAVFHLLEEYLSETLILRLTLPESYDEYVSLNEALASLVNGYNLNIRRVLDAYEGSLAYPLKQYILARFPYVDSSRASVSRANDLISAGIMAGRISPAEVLLGLIATGHIHDDGISEKLINDPSSALEVVIESIQRRELTPQMFNIDPSTASAVVTCTHTGEVLAAVSYPSFDNNRLVGDFDNEYFHTINVLCPTHPMINRPFVEARAPGSTFKMFTAVAALEAGVINPGTQILDGVRFTAAGDPPISCWRSSGHGLIDVVNAIAVSCNFFFAEAAFRLGNERGSRTMEGIATLNKYMEFFGLNGPTGVEIGERNLEFTRAGYYGNTMASPEFKRHVWLSVNPYANEDDMLWTDRDTAQVSIGQGYNAYTAAQMARGMSIIANRGVNFPLTLISRVETFEGQTVRSHEPMPVNSEIRVQSSTWDAVIEGMRLVTEPGANGTAVDAFADSRVRVAGKTGTAEQIVGRFSHHSFGAFAPLEAPVIAVYVNVPFGRTDLIPQIAARISNDIIEIKLGNSEMIP